MIYSRGVILLFVNIKQGIRKVKKTGIRFCFGAVILSRFFPLDEEMERARKANEKRRGYDLLLFRVHPPGYRKGYCIKRKVDDHGEDHEGEALREL